MIFKYKLFTEAGVNGFTIYPKVLDTEELVQLGSIDGWNYAYSDTVQEQDERIGWQEVTLESAQKEALKAQMMAQSRKAFARMKVEDIGDVYDLIADAMKLIEFNMMLTARLAGDVWGTNVIPEDKKALYAARNKGFLDAVEAGAITLRGDFDDMDTLMARLMWRYSKINEVVRDAYVNELKRVGL